MTVDWDRLQKCDVCDAPLGKPCRELTGFVVAEGMAVGMEGVQIAVDADRPHAGRKLRAGYARGER